MTPGTFQPFRDALARARGSLIVEDEARWIATTKVCTYFGGAKPGSTSSIATSVRVISPETIRSVRVDAT
jgi:hypothetical protein